MNLLYVGKVSHRRARPKEHSFSYGVYWMLLDLDDLDSANRVSRLFSVDRPNVYSFRQGDHGPRDGSSLKAWITSQTAHAGIEIGRVRLLTMPRLFGYAFNPLSIWFCDDPSGNLAAVLYEVRNTFGEYHSYLLPVDDASPVVHEWDKQFFVSPFIDMGARYRFALSAPGELMKLTVSESDMNGHLFSAVMSGRRAPLTTRTLVRLLVSHPLITFRVMIGIHWQALLLWRKGAEYRRRPEAPSSEVSMPLVDR